MLDKTIAKQRIDELVKIIEEHNYRYYQLSNPIISDYEFDQLLQELINLETEYPEFRYPYSPTQRVGGSITKTFQSVVHQYPMLSLSNSYSEEELIEFDNRIKKLVDTPFSYTCELKIDGVAIGLTYKNGELVLGATRGDGLQGDNITNNIKTIKTIPLRLNTKKDFPAEFEVRGEVFMPIKVMEKLNKEKYSELIEKGFNEEEIQEQLLKNPRNAASGSLKLQDPKMVAKRNLDCFLYFLYTEPLPSNSHYANLMLMKEWGFKVSDATEKCATIQDVLAYIKKWETKRYELPYDTDGIVVKVDEIDIQKILGNTAKSPRWAIAFKYKPAQATTILENIIYQVGRTGAITPVAQLKPVFLAGTTVKRASLHNADFIQKMDLRLNDTVLIEKGGEIIPKIVGVDITKRNLFSAPINYITHCPDCHTALIKHEAEALHYCPNETSCPTQIVGKIIHFTSRKAMNIEGLGEKTIEALFQNGYIRSVADLYDLTAQHFLSLEGFKEQATQNALTGIEKSKNTPFEKVLFAIGIRYVGETVAKKLAQYFKNIDKLQNATLEELMQVDEIGETIAKSILNYFKKPYNKEIIQKLKEHGLKFEIDNNNFVLSDKLKGLNFVVSGVFQNYEREQIKQLIEQHGGKLQSSVSAKTNYLLAGDNIGPAKLKKAETLKIPIINEKDLETMLG